MTNLSEMNIYENIRTTVTEAQKKVYATVNFVMVETYWSIGKQICEAQGKNDRDKFFLLSATLIQPRSRKCEN